MSCFEPVLRTEGEEWIGDNTYFFTSGESGGGGARVSGRGWRGVELVV